MACKGEGERCAGPGHTRAGGLSKEWNYKNVNAVTRWFSNCKSTNTSWMDLIFSKLALLSTLIITYSNAGNSPFLHYQRLSLQVYGARPVTLTVTWLVPDLTIKRKSQKKDWKIVRIFLIQPSCFFKSGFVVFMKRNRFLFFFQKNSKTPFWIVFIALCNITICRNTQ